MAKDSAKKMKTDEDVKRKAVKLVVVHLKKKIDRSFSGKEHVQEWIERMEELLQKESFDVSMYHQMRRDFNDVIERTSDSEMRAKLRDSWYSLGKALDKKLKPY